MIGSGFSFGLGATLGKVAARGVSSLSYIKDNLKIYFDFASSRAKTLEFVGTGSVNFPGSNDFLKYDDSIGSGASTYSVSMWVRKDSTTQAMYLFDARGDSSTGTGYAFVNANGVGFGDSGTNTWYIDGVVQATPTLTTGQWHHAVVTGISLNINEDFKIGVNKDSSTFEWIGNMCQIGLWNRTLSASEVQNIVYKTYSDLKGTEKTHLVSWWRLDLSLDTYNDSHGTNNLDNVTTELQDGIYANYSPRKPRGFDNAPTAQADLIGSGSASFTGSNDDYITCGNSSDFKDDPDGEEFTLTAWFKGAAGADGTILSKADNSNRAIQIFTETDDTLKANIGGTSLASATVVADNTWHHVALRSFNDGGTYKGELYVDGIFKVVGTTGSTTATGMDFLIGARRHDDNTDTGYEITGNIAQVGFWGSALTQEQIQSISQKSYSDLTTSEKTNLLSWWGLDAVYGSEWSPHASGSGMVVDDKAGTESLGTELTTSLTWSQNSGNEFETFSSSGNEITNAINTSGSGICQTSTFSLEANAFYKLSFNLGYSPYDGDNDTINVVCIGVGDGLGLTPRPFQLSNWSTTGSQTYYFKAPSSLSTYRFGFQTGSSRFLTLSVSDLSIKKVTGKNFGTLE